MTKKQLISKINDNYDYIKRMQQPIGHDSWWYSNRSSDDCINVKIHPDINTDAVTALLTNSEREKINILHINIDEVINEEVWGWYGLLDQARREFDKVISSNDTETLPTVKNVEGVEYCGRSGGWLCVQYYFGNLLVDMENIINGDTVDMQTIRKVSKDIDSALLVISETTERINEMKKELEKTLSDAKRYASLIRYHIINTIKIAKETAKINTAVLEKIAQL